jgi:hypothetical protein
MADGARAPGFEICGRWVPPCVVLLAVVAACGRIPERDLREAEQADELPPEVIAAVPQPRPAEILGSASAFVGFLYKDGLLRNPFAYGQGAWTTWPDSRPLPTNWTLYGFGGTCGHRGCAALSAGTSRQQLQPVESSRARRSVGL